MNHDRDLKVKIDTKEKMHVITIEEPFLAANMTETYSQLVVPFLKKSVKNVVVNFEATKQIEIPFAVEMIRLQAMFYENNASMVFCNLSKDILRALDAEDLLDAANITPTESEAWDIVQMDEIERELL